MPTLELLFIIIISILVVSVVLSVIDWIYLAALSSKAMLLEREVEKKSLEFDTLKKERAGARLSMMHSASVIESTEPLTGDSSGQQQSIEDTIQIVRNVRGNFERTEHFTHDISPYPQESPVVHTPSPPSPSIVPEAAPPVFIRTTPRNERSVTDTAPQFNSSGTGYPPLSDTTAPDTAARNIPQQAEPVTFKLYAEVKRDADFQLLWQNITRAFQFNPQPHVIVDLAGINFMYDKEMDYLEKIKYLLTGRGGSFEFINCDQELFSLFNRRPQLLSIVH